MKTIFILNCFLLFFLISITNEFYSFTELEQEEDCINYYTLQIGDKITETKKYTLLKECQKYVLYLNITIQKDSFDVIKLELIDEKETDVDMYFYSEYKSNEYIVKNKTIIELKRPDIIKDEYYLKIVINKEEENIKEINLRYTQSNYGEKKEINKYHFNSINENNNVIIEKYILPENSLVKGTIEKNNENKYIGNFSNENKGEIYIDFLEGEGETSMNINTGNNQYNINFDYYNKKYDLNGINCDSNTCEFELSIYLPSDKTYNSKYNYNIFYNKNNPSSIKEIPAFETIYGSLDNKTEESKIHDYVIEKKGLYYNSELDCDYCEMNCTDVDNEKMNCSIILKEGKEKTDYNFRINFYNNTNETILYHLNSIRNHHYCEINIDKPCYYLVNINKNNKITNLKFLVQNYENAIIYLKQYDNKESEESIYNEIYNNKIIYTKDTSDSNIKNYLEYVIKGSYEGNILIKVVSNNKNKMRINLVFNIFDTISFPNDNIYKEDFIIINSDIKEDINALQDAYYILDINLINGKGEIEVNLEENKENKKYILKRGFKENVNLVLSMGKNYIININNVSKTNSVLSYRKIRNYNKINIKEIYFGKNNYFFYPSVNEDRASLRYYINLNDVNIMGENIYLNYKYFKDIYPNYPIISLYLVDKNYILNEKNGISNPLTESISNSNDYITMIGAGNAKFKKEDIINDNINNERKYLFIKFQQIINEQFEYVISLTDLSDNYPIPTNEYLLFFIENENLKFNLSNKYESLYNSYIEASCYDINIIFDNENYNQDGKTFYYIQNKNSINLDNKDISSNNKYNLLIKYGFNIDKNIPYFVLKDNIIKYSEEQQSISFYPVQLNPENTKISSLNYIVTYTVLLFTNDGADQIIFSEPPLDQLLLKDVKGNNLITKNISSILNKQKGKAVNLTIFADARINEEEHIYEYLVYEKQYIEIYKDNDIVDITIGKVRGDEKVYFTNDPSFNASIDEPGSSEIQYLFVKFAAKFVNKKSNKRIKNALYASTDPAFLNSTNIEKDYEFRSIDSYDDIIISIPYSKLIESGEDTAKNIYIRTTCKKYCSFDIYYKLEDGRGMEGIKIHPETCFEILLEGIEEEEETENYRFVFNVEKKQNTPLITFTTHSVNNFTAFAAGLEADYFRRNFFNGYSFIFQYTKGYYEYHTFFIKPERTELFRVCHRIIDSTDERNVSRVISFGEEIYSTIMYKYLNIFDCFQIEPDIIKNYDAYNLYFTSKTKNIEFTLYDSKADEYSHIYISTEDYHSGVYTLNSNYSQFCISIMANVKEIELSEKDCNDIYFQVLGIDENDEITQNLTAPSINGLYMGHDLDKGQSFYYKLYKLSKEDKYINIYFQTIDGKLDLFKSTCNVSDDCSFDLSDENTIKSLKNITNYFYEGNIVFQDELTENEEYYEKVSYPVYIVHCKEVIYKKYCTYYISLNTGNDYLQIYEEQTSYYYINKSIPNQIDAYRFSNCYYIANNGDRMDLFIEVVLLYGKLNKVTINTEKEIFSYDDKAFYYKALVKDIKTGFNEHNIEVSGDNNTLFYVNYYLIHNNDNVEETLDEIYYLTKNRMFYNLLGYDGGYLTYQIKDDDIEEDEEDEEEEEDEEKYIISVSGLNSYLGHSLNDYSTIKQYTQIQDENYGEFYFKCYSGEGSKSYSACEFVISFSKLKNDGSINKVVEFDGFYQYYIINNEDNIKKINLYYYFTEDELKELNNKKILVNVNKNSLDDLTIKYAFNSEEPKESIIVHRYNELFRIDYNNNNIFNTNFIKKNYLFITITSDSTIEFKIRTNVKNLPTHLDTDAVEFGYLNNNEYFIYYFDYIYDNDKAMGIDTLQELYLYNKGNVKFKIVVLKFEGIYANNAYNMTNIDFDDPSISYIDNNSGKNHIRINGKEYGYDEGCRFVLKVYLDNNETNINNKEIFYIYRHVQNYYKTLLVELNTNIFGNFYGDIEKSEEEEESDEDEEEEEEKEKNEIYYFYTDLKKLKGDLIINLNCEKCEMCIYEKKDESPLCSISTTKSTIIYHDDDILQNTYLYSYIKKGEGHYQLSFSDSSLPKYIEELHPEMCFNSCKFVFPLRNYYNYINNIGNDTIIILHSPDEEKIRISYELVDIDKLNTELDDFNLTNNNYGNGLFIKLNTSEIKEKGKILRIHVISENNVRFNFIMNKIIYSENTEDIIYTKKIIYMDKESEEIKNDIISLENDIYYKIDLNLICGKGRVILDNENQYELNYEYQPSISLIIKTLNSSISSLNLDKDNNFTFFINATKIGNDSTNFTEILDTPKVHKILYYADKENNNSDIFPIKFKVQKEKDKTVYINYRFIEIESNETNKTEKEIYELDNYEFYLNYSNNEDITNFQSIYYTELQRGFASMQFNDNSESNFVDIIINKNESLNNNTYKKLYLEITPIYINYKSKEIEKIYIPRNVYIQIDINKTLDFIFIKSNHECNITKIDIGNSSEISIDNPDKYEKEIKNGKYKYSINDNTKSEYNIKINPITNGSLIIKYTSKRNSYPNFDIYNDILEKEWPDESVNLFTLKYQNIDTTTNNKEAKKGPNYKISYIIRIYDYLNFYEDNEVESIMIKQNALKVFRKDLPDDKFNETTLDYKIDFGTLEKKKYYINVLASASYNNSVEYFSYKQLDFRISQVEETNFDQSWAAPLVIVLILFVSLATYMVYKIIKEIREKKVENQSNDLMAKEEKESKENIIIS